MKKAFLKSAGFLLLFLTGCQWENVLELEMDDHKKEVVVECYIEPGRPFRLVLSETSNFLDAPSTPYIYDAKVIISYKDKEVELSPNYVYYPASRKFYNYISEDTVPELYDTDFHLEIKTQKKVITGTTRMLRPKKITNLNYVLNSEGMAYVNIEFEKDAEFTNFYRLVVNRDSIRGTNYVSLPLSDEYSVGPGMQFSTGYDFSENETVVVTVFHINKDYYNFLESVQNAIIANINPFSQPNAIISNINGGVGIFTALNFDRKEIVIRKQPAISIK